MKKLLASLGLGLFALTSISPAFAQETIAGTMVECMEEQAELVTSFQESLREIEKNAKTGARDEKLIENFRKRLVRIKKMTPEMQKVIDEEGAWESTLGETLEGYFTDWAAMIDGMCSTNPAAVKGLFVAFWSAQVEWSTNYLAYIDWLGSNGTQYRKTVPAAIYRKRQKAIKQREETVEQLATAKRYLAEANALSSTTFED